MTATPKCPKRPFGRSGATSPDQTSPFALSQAKARNKDQGDPVGSAMDHVRATNRPLLTPADVATLLGVSERTLERWRQTGEGPAYHSLTRKTVRYAAIEVASFIESSRKQNTAQ